MTIPISPFRCASPSDTGLDDTILPFAVKALDLRGRIVRLGPAVDTILTSHDYPPPVAKLLGEAIVLTVMLGSALKFDGRFILQTQSDGPVRMLVVDFTSPGNVRACARFDAERVARAIAADSATPGKLLGHGHLAMTIDQGAEMSRYQGLVPLEGGGLEQAAHEYFSALRADPDAGPACRRRRIPRRRKRRAPALARRRHFAAVPAQFARAPAPGRSRSRRRAPRDRRRMWCPKTTPGSKAARWSKPSTIIELLDPDLSSERLAYRLFHERGVRVFRAAPVNAQCSCSRDSVENMLQSFSQEDRDDMVENGRITVTCEFCSSTYVFAPDDIATQEAATG